MSDLLGFWYTRLKVQSKVKFCFQSKNFQHFSYFILTLMTNCRLVFQEKHRLFDFTLAIVYTGGLESQRRRNYGTGSKHPRANWDLVVNIVCLLGFLQTNRTKKKSVKLKLIMRSKRLFNCLILSFMYEYILGGDSGRGWLVGTLVDEYIYRIFISPQWWIHSSIF